MSITLSGLHLYPIKSCAALSPSQAVVEPRGLAQDRRWMIVDARGRFVTGREVPRLVLIRADPGPHGLRLRAPGMPEIFVGWPPPSAPRTSVTVWKSTVEAQLSGLDVDIWVSRFLQYDARLVHMDARSFRPIAESGAPTRPHAGDEVSFADAYPLLLISQASLDGLNARLQKPVPMLRFRPNLVVDGVPEHAEDGWRRIRIAGIEFEFVKPCTRCGFTTVMPETGTLDPSGEPLRTLARYRRHEKGVIFGQNLIARGVGRLRLGDTVEVMA